MHSSRYAAPHEQDAMTLPRPLRLVSNALIGLCLLALLLALPALLGSTAQEPVVAAACSGCVPTIQVLSTRVPTMQPQTAQQPSSP